MKNKKIAMARNAPATEAKEAAAASGSINVFIESRALGTVTCPHCWTEQRTNRNFCYQCAAQFHYLDEVSQIG